MSALPRFNRAAIIGLGLMGGSIAAGLKRQGIHISAYDAQMSHVESGLALGIIDQAAQDVTSAVKEADLIVIAVPVLAMVEVFKSIKSCFNQSGIVITDVGSVKTEVLVALESVADIPPRNFVPGHPIAGSEKHGVTASNPDLFEKHKVILTPTDDTDPVAIRQIEALWQSLGADVTQMSVSHHDLVLAQTSHLPHLLAFALIDTLSLQGDSLEIFDFAAGGLRDFSRIAASDPTMWRDIFKSNSKPLLEILDRYMGELAELRGLIEADKMTEVFTLLERAKTARDHFSQLLNERSQ